MSQTSSIISQFTTIVAGNKTFSPSFDTTTNVPALTFLCMEVYLKKHAGKFVNQIPSGYQDVVDRHLGLVAHREELIGKVFCTMKKVGAYVFGGYLRDMVAGIKFNDIDIRVKSDNEKQSFISEILEFADIFVENKNIYPCFTCTNIRVQSRCQRNIWLDIDLTLETNFELGCKVYLHSSFDFDVNMLKSKSPDKSLKLINKHCNMPDIFKNISQKEFVILDKIGQPSFQHWISSFDMIAKKTADDIQGRETPTNYGDTWTFVPNSSSEITESTCISRSCLQGRNLLRRIEKMERRGWFCINKTCDNPNCIAAIPDMRQAYVAFQIAEEQMEMRKRIRKMELRAEAYREFHLRFYPSRITGKMANIINFSKSEKSYTIDHAKSVKRQKKITNHRNENALSTKSSRKVSKKNKENFYLMASIKEELNSS